MATRPNLAALAWRNLWRNRRRTLITVFGIAFGMFLAVIFTGLGDASYSKMIDDAAKGGAGHVTVQHRESADLPSPKKTVTGFEAIDAAGKRLPQVRKVVPRITGAAMLATSSNSFGAFFMAIDPEHESADTFMFLDSIVEGDWMHSTTDLAGVQGLSVDQGTPLAAELKAWRKRHKLGEDEDEEGKELVDALEVAKVKALEDAIDWAAERMEGEGLVVRKQRSAQRWM